MAPSRVVAERGLGWRRIAGFGALAILATFAAVMLRTVSSRSLQVEVRAVQPLELDAPGVLARLAAAIGCRTVTTEEGPEDPESFRELHAFLRDAFPRVHAELAHETINDWSLLFTWRGSDPALDPLLLMGHLDVVPVPREELEAWELPPFAGEISGEYLYGRGALDDKSGVLAILEAVELHLAHGFRPERTILLAFGHDEERGGGEGARAIRDLLATRGHDRFAMVLDEGGVVTEGRVPGLARPVALIGIAEKGSVTLTLTVEGAGGHSAAPPRHTNIGRLARAIARLEEEPFPRRFDGVLETMFEFLGPEMPLLPRAAFSNTWLFGGLLEARLASTPESLAMLHTTTAATMIEGGIKENVLPRTARAVLNLRILPGETPSTVAARVRSIIDDPAVIVAGEEGGRAPSRVSDPHSSAFRLLGATVREVLGTDVVVAPYLVTAATDARYYAERSAVVFRFLPVLLEPDGLSRIHGVNERISTDGYLNCVRFYHRLIEQSDGLP